MSESLGKTAVPAQDELDDLADMLGGMTVTFRKCIVCQTEYVNLDTTSFD